MTKRNWVALVGTMLLSGLIGCGAEEPLPAAAESAQAVDVPPQPESEDASTAKGLPLDGETMTCNGECCRYSCTNGRAYYSRDPICSTCINWARYACPRFHGSSYIEGSANWGRCG